MILANKFSDSLKVLFLFICLLYGWIPFEAGSFDVSLRIHFIFLALLIVYVLYIESFKLSTFGVSFFIFFIFLSSCLFFISYGRAIYSFIPSIAFASIVGPVIYKNKKFRHHFTQALFLLIIVSISMVFLQVIVFIMTNDIILLHEFVFPFSKARIAIELQFNDIRRMGGMYIEPGTYSNYMFLLLTIYLLLKKQVNYVLVFFIAISMIATYSLWGMMFASYLLFLIFLVKLFSSPWKVKVLLIALSIFIVFYMLQSIENNSAIQYGIEKLQRNGGQDSSGAKKMAYEKFSNDFDEFFILGGGFAPKFKEGIAGFQDAGLFLNFLVVFGILPTIILFSMYIFFFLKLTNYTIVLISLPIFMSKVFYWDPALWLLIFMIFYEYIIKTKKLKFRNMQ